MRPNRIVLDVQSETGGIVVLSEVFYPGWRASVNGRAAPVMRANFLFRAVEAPAGASRVVLTYSPTLWWWGVGLCGLTLILLIGPAVVAHRRRQVF